VAQTVVIDRRFRGPPQSGNGGYTAGLAARALGSPVVEVTLLAPPPLDTALTVAIDGPEIALVHDGRELVRARTASLDFEPPPAPAMIDAAAARGRYVGLREPHIVPGCFVCGPERAPGDGLRVFAGPLDPRPGGTTGVAATWLPDDDLTADDGLVGKEFLWAALDCPSYFALPRANAFPALLGRMTGEVRERPRAGEPLTVAAWAAGSEGRKHNARSAVYGADGRLIAKAHCLWIEPRPKEG
jgi:hypothetical protein